ncbi:MAG: hypothetical protein Ct9H300mP12_00530 [Acidimicrobiales bacterium]|nr:MAG: hypothetical protein Ct9H300mP12_00530 [Acidimicrobiales bacterium]
MRDGAGGDADRWLEDRLDIAAVELDRPARNLVVRRLGEDRARSSPAGHLAAVFGIGAAVGVSDVEPFPGTGGDVAPWD